MSTIYKVFVPTTKAVVSEHTDVKEANKACVEFNKENGGIALVMMAEVDEPAPTAEKIYTYTNNTHCPGNRAKIKVESHKYPNETHNGHSVWVEYYFDERQLKSCFRHNNYMDAEKFYKKVGRSWVEFNFDPIANEKAICEKAEKIENIVERLNAKKAEAEKAAAEEKAEEIAPVTDETVPEETDDNEGVFFTYDDIYEGLETIVHSSSSKLQVELHHISEVTDIPKSIIFYKQPCGNIGIQFINYDDDNDPLAETYDFAEDYLRENISAIAFELKYRPFNDDI